jgi:DNA-binding CsgD family transcriptional regulator
MGTAIPIPTGENATIILSRRMEYGPFDRASANRLDELRPHLARSVLISARLQLDRARVAGDALAALGIPALVFDETGKVLSANALIEEMTGYVHWRAFDRVSLKDRVADQLLRGAIAIIDSEKGSGVRSFPIRDAEAESTMVAHVIPVRLSARDIFLRCAGVLAMTPVTAPRAPPVELVQSLFDLTPTEARVARSLASGKTVEDIASDGGVSLNTVRTHVRGVLAKTGCGRQLRPGSAEDTRAFATERASLCDLASCAVSSTLMRRPPQLPGILPLPHAIRFANAVRLTPRPRERD